MSARIRSLPMRESSAHGSFLSSGEVDRLARPDERLLRVADVCEIVRVDRSTWYRWVKKGVAPKPVRFGGSTFWTLTSVRRFIQEVIDAAES